jgi:hypothetical protein
VAPQLTAGAAKPPADAASSPAAAPAKPTGKAREARVDAKPAES